MTAKNFESEGYREREKVRENEGRTNRERDRDVERRKEKRDVRGRELNLNMNHQDRVQPFGEIGSAQPGANGPIHRMRLPE